MYTKLTLRFVIFILVIIPIWKFLDVKFRTDVNYKNTISDFEDIVKESNVDVLIFGSSHAYCTYNPYIINRKAELVSFNLGGPAQRLTTTKHLLLEALKSTSAKLVVIDIYSLTVETNLEDEKEKSYQLNTYDNTPFSTQKTKDIYSNFERDEFIPSLSPFIRNHNNFVDVKLLNKNERFLYKELYGRYFFDGYLNNNAGLNKKDKEKYENVLSSTIKNNTVEAIPLKPSEKEVIDAVIEIANSKGVSLLFSMSPTLRFFERGEYYKRQLGVIDYLKERKVDFLNYHDFVIPLDLKLSDFSDPGHLNNFGANKVSTHFSKYIRDNYKFVSRSSDVEYKKLMKRNLSYQLENSLNEAFYSSDINHYFLGNLNAQKIGIIRENDNQIIVIFELDQPQKSKEIEYFRIDYTLKTSSSYFDDQFPERIVNEEIKGLTPKLAVRNGKYYIYNRLQVSNSIIIDIEFNMINKINKVKSEPLSLSKTSEYRVLKLK